MRELLLLLLLLLLLSSILVVLPQLCLSKRRSVWLFIRLAEHSEPWVHSGDPNRQSVRWTKSTLSLWRGALHVTLHKAGGGSGTKVTGCDSKNGAAQCHFWETGSQVNHFASLFSSTVFIRLFLEWIRIKYFIFPHGYINWVANVKGCSAPPDHRASVNTA